MSNTENLSFPLYEEVAAYLQPVELLLSPSELHGLICGYICGAGQADWQIFSRLLTVELDLEQLPEAIIEPLQQLFNFSEKQLKQASVQIDILLPDDQTPISTQVLAFTQWVAGFLHGIAQTGIDETKWQSVEAKEGLEDLTKICEIDVEQVSEQDDFDFNEVIEYVKVVVLTLYTELHPLPANINGSTQSH